LPIYAPIAMGIAMSRWFFQTAAINKILIADRAQTISPATKADSPASKVSTVVNTTAVRTIASRVGHVACRNIPHQPFLFTVFLAILIIVSYWAVCSTLGGFCRTHFIEFAVVGTANKPGPQSQ